MGSIAIFVVWLVGMLAWVAAATGRTWTWPCPPTSPRCPRHRLRTAVYLTGILLRKLRRYWGLGADSWAVLLIYILGTRGFMLISG